MSEGALEVFVGDVTDMEARVYARIVRSRLDVPSAEAGSPVVLVGNVRGPYCEHVKTLPAEFELRGVAAEEGEVVRAVAVVTDPCMWSAEMPQLYDVDVDAHRGEEIVAEYHGKIGFRRLAPRRPIDFAPGTG